MHIEITAENMLIQLGYPTNDALMKQMNRAIETTDNFDMFSKHILSLKDEIAHFDGYIALSNSKDLLKIKCDATSDEIIKAYKDALRHWSDKYKVTLEQVGNTNTYYILGHRP